MITTNWRDRFIAIAPGLHSAGWAVFEAGQHELMPSAYGLVHPKLRVCDADHLMRAKGIADEFAYLAFHHEVKRAYIEHPVFYANSAGGHMAAATGDLLKLCACVGAIAGALKVPVHPVFVPDWKGQLPKPLVNTRIKRILQAAHPLGFQKDEWDAVGIGLFVKGAFK